ncbi:MAG: DUF488 domain-containing protein [Bacteroidales bacterium]|nr:DUF488 domain-containing protein [Bacteroidales bacterium]
MKSKIKCCKTIGHSNLSIEQFVENLEKHNINCVVDVRSHPYAKYTPQFNKNNLKISLGKSEIIYLHLGDSLGARFNQKDLLMQDGTVDLIKVGETDFFKKAIARLKDGINQGYEIAIMCSEQDPLDCHRFVLVARALKAEGIIVEHILKNGCLESNNETEKRLLAHCNLDDPQLKLFHESKTEDEQLLDAYRIRGIEIGYKKEV